MSSQHVKWWSQQPTVCGSATLSKHAAVTTDAMNSRFQHQRNKQPHHQPVLSVSQVLCSSRTVAIWLHLQVDAAGVGKPNTCPKHCPTRNITRCHCRKMWHYAAVCRWTNSCTVAYMNTVLEEALLGATDSVSCWTRCVFINDVSEQMKLGTGADVTTIPEMVYHPLPCSSPTLVPPLTTWWKTATHSQ